jgi:putative hemolysin
MTLSLPLIAALLIMAWLTAGSMAVRSVSRIWLRHWAERQLRGAAAAVAYLERPHRLLTGASAGTSLTLLLAGMAVGLAGTGVAVFWAALAFAGIIVLAGQLIPRAIARRWPAAVAPIVLPVLRVVDVITLPIVNAGEAIAHMFVRE